MPDTVFIRDLRFKTIIGCWDWERQLEQQIVINIEIESDCAAAAAGDDLDKAIDYAAVSSAVMRCVQDGKFRLVESAAEAVARMIIDEFAAPAVRVSIAKPRAVAEAAAVGVTVERRAGG